MNRILKILLATLILGILILLTFLCKAGVKCENCDQTSISIQESKQNGFYLSKYASDKSSVDLKYNKQYIKIKNIWCERVWHYDTENCFSSNYNSLVNSKNGYNIIVEFTKSSDSFLFTLTPIIDGKLDNGNGGIESNRKTMRFKDVPEQLQLVIYERNPDLNIGWQKPILSDTLKLKYIR